MSPAAARTVFITGGASGLGLALARQYLAEGWRVAVADRDGDALARVGREALPGALLLACDVTSESDMTAVRDALASAWERLDLVINNAGVAVAGTVEECPQADWDWIVGINLLGVVRGCRLFLPRLRAQGHGQLVNVASVAGLIHPPGMAAYCATKAAVVALSQSLQAELDGSGVSVSVVCPAFFRTGLARTSRAATPELQHRIEQLVTGSSVSADEVARKVRAGIARRRFLITTHRRETAAWLLKRLLPNDWFLRLLLLGMRGG